MIFDDPIAYLVWVYRDGRELCNCGWAYQREDRCCVSPGGHASGGCRAAQSSTREYVARSVISDLQSSGALPADGLHVPEDAA